MSFLFRKNKKSDDRRGYGSAAPINFLGQNDGLMDQNVFIAPRQRDSIFQAIDRYQPSPYEQQVTQMRMPSSPSVEVSSRQPDLDVYRADERIAQTPFIANVDVGSFAAEAQPQQLNSWPLGESMTPAGREAMAAAMEIRPNDFIIALMGATGVGKTSFIELLTDEKVEVGNSLESCTHEVGIHKCVLSSGQQVWLVDTPGFDDTHRPDTEILAEVVNWLAASYEQDTLLTGIVYLHRISDPRMTSSSMRNLSMFKKLCGDDGLGNVTLATTFWSKVSEAEGQRKEKELTTEEAFWAYLLKKGSQVVRHDKGRDSAERIVMDLINRHKGKVVLAIQKEVVDEKKTLEETAAGQDMAYELAKVKRQFENAIADLRKDQEEALRKKDEDLQRLLAIERKEFAAKLERTERGQRDLRQTNVGAQEGTRCIVM